MITQSCATRARIPLRLVGKIEKSCLLPEPIRLQDSQNSTRWLDGCLVLKSGINTFQNASSIPVFVSKLKSFLLV